MLGHPLGSSSSGGSGSRSACSDRLPCRSAPLPPPASLSSSEHAAEPWLGQQQVAEPPRSSL
eukprot:205775-Alexandrium_andersonii.AAC.1